MRSATTEEQADAAAEPPRGVVPPATGAIGDCPACGGPLYAWIEAPASDAGSAESYVLDRCERCGLGIVREGEVDIAALIAEARPGEGGLVEVLVPNRRSLQATIGEGRWAALRLPASQWVGTPRSVAELLQNSGRQVVAVRQPVFGVNQLWMWQTLMNGLTLHQNFIREVLAGRLNAATARSRLALAIDSVVSVLATPLVALVAFPAETIAALLRRGGCLAVSVGPQLSSSTSSASSSAPS